ncbi:unnamed protein product [Allacma fusca]|uniref:Uncharacterized protein n=1 Tax=Allacma fusca TaxID=39272 RepID=A0A8J2PGV2_9HEXA|nr:unnamed protein product [Allacma fusca]
MKSFSIHNYGKKLQAQLVQAKKVSFMSKGAQGAGSTIALQISTDTDSVHRILNCCQPRDLNKYSVRDQDSPGIYSDLTISHTGFDLLQPRQKLLFCCEG